MCSHRLVHCTFCEIQLSLNEIDEHESYCGSRTEKCSLCCQYIMIKDMLSHDQLVHETASNLAREISQVPFRGHEMNSDRAEKVIMINSYLPSYVIPCRPSTFLFIPTCSYIFSNSYFRLHFFLTVTSG